MKPITFKYQSCILEKPKDMTDEECAPLPVFIQGTAKISKWELSEKEIGQVKKEGFIWIIVYGDIHPPIHAMAIAEEDMFRKQLIN